MIYRSIYIIILLSVVLLAPASNSQSSQYCELTLAWDVNPEPDLAGYRLYYGSESRYDTENFKGYQEPIDVGLSTKATLTGFQAGCTYYFTATAYDQRGHETDYSIELSHSFYDEKPVTIIMEMPNFKRK